MTSQQPKFVIAPEVPSPPPGRRFYDLDSARHVAAAASATVADLEASSPVQCSAESPRAADVLRSLFPDPGMLVCAGADSSTAQQRMTWEWVSMSSAPAVVLPSPIPIESAAKPPQSGFSLCNRRHLVVELYRGTPDEQAGIILHLAEYAPLRVVCVDAKSGNLNAWFLTAGSSLDAVRDFFRYAALLGADPRTWVPWAMSAMPGAANNRILFYDNTNDTAIQ
jgi:hypothetical protein